jgi:hypothetical protein
VRLRSALVLAVVASLIGLGAVVCAHPPDPTSWATGVYDGGDYDDIVLAVTATDGFPEGIPVFFDPPSPVVVGIISLARPATRSVDPSPLAPIRAPPAH